jgi:hypothetical protein
MDKLTGSLVIGCFFFGRPGIFVDVYIWTVRMSGQILGWSHHGRRASDPTGRVGDSLLLDETSGPGRLGWG